MPCSTYENEPGFPGCCITCHEDELDGYGLCANPVDEDDEVCCYVASWLREKK